GWSQFNAGKFDGINSQLVINNRIAISKYLFIPISYQKQGQRISAVPAFIYQLLKPNPHLQPSSSSL
ncbi:MAG TPA: hypothetical protein VJ987_11665, partial [Anaerolineales bacterium]|nr:hypothetical protein [Anaerolineales bacterium]